MNDLSKFQINGEILSYAKDTVMLIEANEWKIGFNNFYFSGIFSNIRDFIDFKKFVSFIPEKDFFIVPRL